MEQKEPTVDQILNMMAQNLGEEPRPMVLMSKVLPEWIPRQAQERKFVFDLPHIPAKYKHLIRRGNHSSSLCARFNSLCLRCRRT